MEGLEPIKPTADPDGAWRAWSASPRTPADNAKFLTDVSPTLDRAVRANAGTSPSPLAVSRARRVALGAAASYDPGRGRFESHLYNHMQGLKRYQARASSPVRMPERVALDRRAVDMAGRELSDELGRDPTDDELSDRTGLSRTRITRVRGADRPLSSGFMSTLGEGGQGFEPAVRRAPGGPDPAAEAAWTAVYDDLGPLDQKVMEMQRQGVSNGETARRLRRSPGWVSQRKLIVQRMLDEVSEMSLF